MIIEPGLTPKRSRQRAGCLQKSGLSWLGSDRPYLVLVVLVVLTAWCGGAAAQVGTGSAPAVGASDGLRPPPQLPLLSGTQSAGVKMHLGPTGRPCLTVLGSAKPQIINPSIFDHMIMASNDCSQPIKMKVCYYQSTQCVPVDVPAYGRKEALLGIMPAMNQFRFEYREQFTPGIGGVGTGFN